jgi:hypothetical protein
MKIGKVWAPETPTNELSQIAIRELRILIEKIFSYRKKDFPKNDNKRPEL